MKKIKLFLGVLLMSMIGLTYANNYSLKTVDAKVYICNSVLGAVTSYKYGDKKGHLNEYQCVNVSYTPNTRVVFVPWVAGARQEPTKKIVAARQEVELTGTWFKQSIVLINDVDGVSSSS